MTVVIKSSDSQEQLNKRLTRIVKTGKFDASKFAGKMTLNQNPEEIQKRLRDEWE